MEEGTVTLLIGITGTGITGKEGPPRKLRNGQRKRHCKGLKYNDIGKASGSGLATAGRFLALWENWYVI